MVNTCKLAVGLSVALRLGPHMVTGENRGVEGQFNDDNVVWKVLCSRIDVFFIEQLRYCDEPGGVVFIRLHP